MGFRLIDVEVTKQCFDKTLFYKRLFYKDSDNVTFYKRLFYKDSDNVTCNLTNKPKNEEIILVPITHI